jgi:hypothetical protein
MQFYSDVSKLRDPLRRRFCTSHEGVTIASTVKKQPALHFASLACWEGQHRLGGAPEGKQPLA